MKNKKGFTLVELLAVIVILALLATIATPLVLTVQKSIKGKMFDAKDKMIREAAVLCVEKLGEAKKDAKCGTVEKLCDNNFLDVDKDCNGTNCKCQLNPMKNTNMDNCKITNTEIKTNDKFVVKSKEESYKKLNVRMSKDIPIEEEEKKEIKKRKSISNKCKS